MKRKITTDFFNITIENDDNVLKSIIINGQIISISDFIEDNEVQEYLQDDADEYIYIRLKNKTLEHIELSVKDNNLQIDETYDT